MYTHRDLLDLVIENDKKFTFVAGELEVLVEERGDIAIISIRGTEGDRMFSEGGWRDVIRDLLFIPYSPHWLKGIGHYGFLRGAEIVLDKVGAKVSKDKRLVFTGHSLGAAVGLACTLLAEIRGWKVEEFVGFGTPRVFYTERKKINPNVKYTLYRNGKDIVPKIPFLLGRRIVKETRYGKSRRRWPNVSDHRLKHYDRNFKDVS